MKKIAYIEILFLSMKICASYMNFAPYVGNMGMPMHMGYPAPAPHPVLFPNNFGSVGLIRPWNSYNPSFFYSEEYYGEECGSCSCNNCNRVRPCCRSVCSNCNSNSVWVVPYPIPYIINTTTTTRRRTSRRRTTRRYPTPRPTVRTSRWPTSNFRPWPRTMSTYPPYAFNQKLAWARNSCIPGKNCTGKEDMPAWIYYEPKENIQVRNNLDEVSINPYLAALGHTRQTLRTKRDDNDDDIDFNSIISRSTRRRHININYDVYY